MGHVDGQHEVGVVVVTQQLGLLLSQLEHLLDEIFVVVFIAVVAAVVVGLVNLFTQVAVVGVLQEGDQAGLAEGKHPFAFHAIGFGLLGGGVDAALRQTGEVVLVVDDELETTVFLQQIISKLQAQSRELFVDLAQFGLLVGIESSTVTNKVLMIFFYHTDLLIVQSHLVTMLIDVVDLLEEFRVHRDGVAML